MRHRRDCFHPSAPSNASNPPVVAEVATIVEDRREAMIALDQLAMSPSTQRPRRVSPGHEAGGGLKRIKHAHPTARRSALRRPDAGLVSFVREDRAVDIFRAIVFCVQLLIERLC